MRGRGKTVLLKPHLVRCCTHALGKSDKPIRTAGARNGAISFLPLLVAACAGQSCVYHTSRAPDLAEPKETGFTAWTLDTSAAFGPSRLASSARHRCVYYASLPMLQKLHKTTVAGRTTNAPMAFKPTCGALCASQCRICLTDLEVDKSIITSRTLDTTKALVPCCSTRCA